jgi:hypothetical protein
MTQRRHVPFESSEHQETESWRSRVGQGQLTVVPCISAWFDICGYGQVLAQVGWNLTSLRDNGLFDALARAYLRLGHPFIAGVPPMPTERVLIMNDGIARTTDLVGAAYVDHATLLFYARDLLMAHFHLLQVLVDQGLGLRTVLAGGERCQYTPPSVTGESILYHSGEPSAFGKHLLAQQFVYHPPEFQMNTAFAMAYTIEALGSRPGVKPNRVYVAQTWIDRLSAALPQRVTVREGTIELPWGTGPGISISFDQRFPINAKGFSTEVFRVSGFTVHTCFEGEETSFPMNEHDIEPESSQTRE